MNDKSEWFCTDDDCAQYCRRVGPAPLDAVFELFQVTETPNGYQISHGTVDPRPLSAPEVENILRQYGYEGLDDFVFQLATCDDWVYKADGSLDRENSPAYIIDYQLTAEMMFELGALGEYLEDIVFETYEKAERYIHDLVGDSSSEQ